MSNINIYTDGSALGNPGPGGYGIVLKFGRHTKEASQGFKHTTNNRMELLAVIEALKMLKTKDIPVQVFTDSKYVVDAIEKKWLFGWQKRAWKKVKNPDLWQEFLRIYPNYNVKFNWVKGHAGHVENERCDVLAVAAANNKAKHLVDYGYMKS